MKDITKCEKNNEKSISKYINLRFFSDNRKNNIFFLLAIHTAKSVNKSFYSLNVGD